MSRDGFAPDDVAREYNEEGEPLAVLNTDPATENRLTVPRSQQGEELPQSVPTATYVEDTGEREMVERLLEEQASNADAEDRPHFLRNVDGAEVCGQDGQSWPCDTYRRMLERDAAERTGTPDQQPQPGQLAVSRDALESVAAELGVDPHELAARLSSADTAQHVPLEDVAREYGEG